MHHKVIGQLPREALLKTNPLIVDVCSVKVYPKQVTHRGEHVSRV